MEADDVSALSMDGASAIAGKAHMRRLRKDFAKMQLAIPEIEEEDLQQHAEEGRSRQSSGPLQEENARTSGEELIEPFPKTFEEWQRKKERRQRKKEKKDKEKKHKRSGKGSRSSGKREKAREGQPMVGRKAPPIMEISIESANVDDGPSADQRRSSQSQEYSSHVSYPSMAESTTSSSYTRSGIGTSSRSQSQRHSSTLTHESGALEATVQRTLQRRRASQSSEHRSSFMSAKSADSQDYLTTLTGHSTHMTGQTSLHSQSHVTVVTAEDLRKVRANLQRAREEENKVVEIHQRLLREVQLATQRADRANDRRRAVSLELETSSIERVEYQRQLALLQEENERLKKKLRRLEERETERGLDDIMDTMEAKIKALKKQGQRSRQKKELKQRASLDK